MTEPERTSPQQITEAVHDLQQQLSAAAAGTTSRIDCNSENIEQGLAKLVLGIVELLRRLLERQAVRRMEGGLLSDEQVEDMGLALMKLEEKVQQMAGEFGLRPEDLNLDLGPLGNLFDK